MTKQRVIIVDIDGTIADHTGLRGHFDWDKVHLDLPKEDILEVVRLLLEGTGAWPIFLTGRKEQCREATAAWLYEHVLWPWQPLNLIMRPDDDESSGPDFKELVYREVIEPWWETILVLEDRPEVTKRWREMGLTCLQVDNGDGD